MSRQRPAHPPAVTTNIFEMLVTRNVTEQTYDVDDLGYSRALYPSARTIPGYGISSASAATIVSLPRQKYMLDRTLPLDAPPADYKAPITYFPTTYNGR